MADGGHKNHCAIAHAIIYGFDGSGLKCTCNPRKAPRKVIGHNTAGSAPPDNSTAPDAPAHRDIASSPAGGDDD
jgi:hypothetical protein